VVHHLAIARIGWVSGRRGINQGIHLLFLRFATTP
jgi:hypothetical protein